MPRSITEPLVRSAARGRLATRVALALALATAIPTVSSRARADDPPNLDEDKGRDLATDAMGHYNEGEFEAALKSFDEARKVYPAAQVLRMRGYTLMAMERWKEAAEAIEESLKSDFKPLVPRDAEHAEDQLAKVLGHLSVVTVKSKVAGATVTVDGGEATGLPATLRLEPGSHTFVVEAPGHEAVEEKRDLKAGKLELALDPSKAAAGGPKPTPKPVPQKEPDEEEEEGEPLDVFGWFPGQGPLGIGAMSVGVVTGGLGLAAGLYGMSLRDAVRENIATHNGSFDPACATSTDLCTTNLQLINRDGARAADWENAGLVMGIVGGSLFVVGTTLWLFSDDSPLAPDTSDPVDRALRSVSCGGAVTGAGGAVTCHGTF